MIQVEWLVRVISSGARDGGCGMSIRPEYYSGRGATTTDLTGQSLERIYQAILRNVNEEAAREFAKMVADIPVLSATDFLLSLESFVRNEFTWGSDSRASTGGVHATDFGTALGTAMSAGMRDRDETAVIRGQFLHSHGVKAPPSRSLFDRYDADGYYIEHYEYLDGESEPPPALALVDLEDEKG